MRIREKMSEKKKHQSNWSNRSNTAFKLIFSTPTLCRSFMQATADKDKKYYFWQDLAE